MVTNATTAPVKQTGTKDTKTEKGTKKSAPGGEKKP